MLATSRFVRLRPISIAEALTANFIQLGVPQARGIIIPVSALAGGSTLTFYFRNDQGYNQNGGSAILDARAALQGSHLGSDYGPLAKGVPQRLFVDGSDVSGYDASVVLANSGLAKYQVLAVRLDGIARAEGFIYLLMNDNGSGAFQPLKVADVRIYDYTLSVAQLAQPLLPGDYATRYTFAGYQSGDTFVQDVSGNGNHGRIYF